MKNAGLTLGRVRLAAWAVVLALSTGRLAATEPMTGPEIAQELRGFRQLGSVLYIAAHPDDENSQLIAYLARGRNYRTAYLSLTRGDGGQNVIGSEFGENLGLIRTHELLAARRVDGGRQFFTRAIDFGFSKDFKETLGIWDRAQVLGDIVRVIRTFQPDVVVTRFSTAPGGTHGHHTASGVLGLEAFKLAGDPQAYPEQLKDLRPWQPKRIFLNGGGRFGGGGGADSISIEINDREAPPGDSFGDLAGRSRAMHKSQGFGGFGGGGGRGGGGGARSESFRLLAGEPAAKDIMDGVETTWARIPGGAALTPLVEDLITQFATNHPAASVPALLAMRSALAKLPTEPLVKEKREQLDRILQGCLGLSFATTVPHAEVVPGEKLALQVEAGLTSTVPVRWLGVRYPGETAPTGPAIDLTPGTSARRTATPLLPATTPISQPYWLRAPARPGLFTVAETAWIGSPENPPAYPLAQVFAVAGQTVELADEPVQPTTNLKVPVRRRLDVIPPVAVAFASEVQLFAPGAAQEIAVVATAHRAPAAGTVQLDLPPGWTATPANRPLQLGRVGEAATYRFTVTAPAQPATSTIGAHALVNGVNCVTGRREIHYSHLPPLLLQPTANLKAVALQLATRGRFIGYLPGAGDSVADALVQMGYTVTNLTTASLTAEGLHGLDAVVVGIRAFDTHRDLAGHMGALFQFAENGGTVVVQYNRVDGLTGGPLRLRISSDRVTDENAPVTFLAPEHPVLNTPNKITADDFAGWVQERGIYFPSEWDEHYVPILACNDPGENPLRSGLLVAPHGKGWFVYTSMVWFRELPAGVPGAFRLFANLVSLGK